MQTTDFDYELPPQLIAQEPLRERSASRMMVVDRSSGRFEHRRVRDLPGYLEQGDLLVLNDTRVFPARVLGARADTGGQVELLLVEPLDDDTWDAFYRASGRARPGLELVLAGGDIRGTLVDVGAEGRVTVRLQSSTPLMAALESKGSVPLPPYIKRGPDDARRADDRERYQTVYAREPGAVAAPTAGLHLTHDLLDRLAADGVNCARVTLHVGPGTFKPVKAEQVASHRMEEERYEVDEEAATAVNAARCGGGRVVAVGTTTVRTLESAADKHGRINACSGRTSLFVYPPYEFKAVDVLLTNFHLPRSTLLMMVSAFAGRELVLAAYHEAVARGYRFYSYGDCMLLL